MQTQIKIDLHGAAPILVRNSRSIGFEQML